MFWAIKTVARGNLLPWGSAAELDPMERYFPIFDRRDRLTNYFFVVANKKDEKRLITEGNKRVVEARLADAKFFWNKDRSKNLIKQIVNLKSVTFYEKLGTPPDSKRQVFFNGGHEAPPRGQLVSETIDWLDRFQ